MREFLALPAVAGLLLCQVPSKLVVFMGHAGAPNRGRLRPRSRWNADRRCFLPWTAAGRSTL